MICAGCDKDFRGEDTAPYMRNPDGTLTEACRKCIGEWIKLGILWPSIPFWARKQGLDRP
jgi:hypothetical protein